MSEAEVATYSSPATNVMSETLECKLHIEMSQAKNQELGLKQQQEEEEEMHMVMVPYPLQGHINPMMQFAKSLIATFNVKVSFINTKHNHAHIQKKRFPSTPSPFASTMPSSPPALITHDTLKASRGHGQSGDKLQEKLEFLWIDNELPDDFDYTDINARARDFHFSTLNMKGPLKQLLETLNQKSPPISCVIFGSFCSWVHAISAELGIPSVFFWTQSASVLSIYYHAPLLAANGFFPYKKHGVSDPVEEQEASYKTSKLVSYLPGVLSLHPSHIPTLLHVDGVSDTVYVMLREQFNILRRCQGIIINSFEELERDAYQALRKELPFPVSLVGPLIPSAFLEGDLNDTSIGASLLEEKMECIQWLNHQRKLSVLYVSFGSLLHPSIEDLASIANGIKDSKQPFLWVIRPRTSVGNIADILPKEFMDDTREHGLIIPWAPQMQVLSHPSIGAFLTHCGWNSTLESVSMGVPMITCPLSSDQPTNATYVCEFWKVGMALKRHGDDSLRSLDVETGRTWALKRHNDGSLRSLDVERVVRTVLGEQGEEIRKRAMELQEAARRAARAQGSSCNHMEEFIQAMRRNGS